ncbi:MAG: hypothetical protein LYZ70_07350 [Nitrososphaerales archaeon]|nr:hypothetical protein [Nitrososphaerales archaeon]
MTNRPEGRSVKVYGDEAVLHITDQSVMLEKGGEVSGIEGSTIRLIKPDGDAMMIAYSATSEPAALKAATSTFRRMSRWRIMPLIASPK